MKDLVRFQIVHFGKIAFNWQFVVLALMLSSVLSFIIPVVYYVILFAIMLFTLFTIFVMVPDFGSWFAGGEVLLKVTEILARSWQYTIPLALVLAVLSVACLSLDRNGKHRGRIVFSVIVAVCACVILILKLVNQGGLA